MATRTTPATRATTPTTGAGTRAMRTAGTRARRTLIAHLVLIAFVVIALFPFYWMVATSLKSIQEALATPPTFFPAQLQWGNYPEALSRAPFGRFLLNTFFVASMCTICNVLSSVLAAYAFALTNFPGKRVVFALLLTTLMIPYDVILIPNFVLIRDLNLYNTYWAQILPWAAGTFGIFLLRQFFLSIPKEIFEAAVVDGASPLRVLWQVAVPLARPAIVTVALFSFLGSWNAFSWPLIVTSSNDVRPVQVGLRSFVTEASQDYNLLMAATAITIVPIVILYFFVQRQLIEGVAASGVKG